MINIVVIGAGNVGIHLCKAIIKAKGLNLKQWYNRSKIQKINSLENIPFTNDITNLGTYIGNKIITSKISMM